MTDGSNGPITLLKQYHKKCTVLNKAHTMQETYWRNMGKYLSYPIVVLSAVGGITALLPEINHYILAGLSFSTLVLSGFIQAVNPSSKEIKNSQVKTEYGELSANIHQYLLENDKTKDEYKAYSQSILPIIEIWDSLSPPVKSKFIKLAEKEYMTRESRLISANKEASADHLRTPERTYKSINIVD